MGGALPAAVQYKLWGCSHIEYLPILKWSKADKEVLRGNNGALAEKCCALIALDL